MMNHVRSFVLAVLAAAALMLVPQTAHAQQAITADFEGGYAIPAGDIADAIDPGPAFTVGVNFKVHDMLSIRAEGGADLYQTTEVTHPDQNTRIGPDVTLTRLDLGVVLHAIQPDMGSGLWVDADVAGGYHILTSDNYEIIMPTGTETLDISSGYLGAKGGLTFGYHFSDAVSAFVGGDAYMVPGDNEDLEPFTDIGEVGGSTAETHWSFPVQAGLRLHFQP